MAKKTSKNNSSLLSKKVEGLILLVLAVFLIGIVGVLLLRSSSAGSYTGIGASITTDKSLTTEFAPGSSSIQYFLNNEIYFATYYKANNKNPNIRLTCWKWPTQITDPSITNSVDVSRAVMNAVSSNPQVVLDLKNISAKPSGSTNTIGTSAYAGMGPVLCNAVLYNGSNPVNSGTYFGLR